MNTAQCLVEAWNAAGRKKIATETIHVQRPILSTGRGIPCRVLGIQEACGPLQTLAALGFAAGGGKVVLLFAQTIFQSFLFSSLMRISSFRRGSAMPAMPAARG